MASISLPDDLVARLQAAAEEAGFDDTSDKNAQLAQFIEVLLADEDPLEGDDIESLWLSFSAIMYYQADQAAARFADFGCDLQLDVDVETRGLIISLFTDLEHRKGEIEEREPTLGTLARIGKETYALSRSVAHSSLKLKQTPRSPLRQPLQARWLWDLVEDIVYKKQAEQLLFTRRMMSEEAIANWSLPPANIDLLLEEQMTGVLGEWQREIPFDEARDYLAFAEEVAPNSVAVMHARAKLALEHGDAGSAKRILETAAAIFDEKAFLRKEDVGRKAGLQGFDRPNLSAMAHRNASAHMATLYLLLRLAIQEGDYERSAELVERFERLDHRDGYGIRFIKPSVLVLLERFDEAEKALAALLHSDVGGGEAEEMVKTIHYYYSHALLLYIREQDSEEANQALEEAFGYNPHLPIILAQILIYNDGELPLDLPPYSMGSEEECLTYLDSGIHAWLATPGAIAWMGHQARSMAIPEREAAEWETDLSSGSLMLKEKIATKPSYMQKVFSWPHLRSMVEGTLYLLVGTFFEETHGETSVSGDEPGTFAIRHILELGDMLDLEDLAEGVRFERDSDGKNFVYEGPYDHIWTMITENARGKGKEIDDMLPQGRANIESIFHPGLGDLDHDKAGLPLMAWKLADALEIIEDAAVGIKDIEQYEKVRDEAVVLLRPLAEKDEKWRSVFYFGH